MTIRERLKFTTCSPGTTRGSSVWREGCNYYTVQGAKVDIKALLENTGFAASDDYKVDVWLGTPNSNSSPLTTQYATRTPPWQPSSRHCDERVWTTRTSVRTDSMCSRSTTAKSALRSCATSPHDSA